MLREAAWGLAADLGLALLCWTASRPLRDVSIVDAAWGPMVAIPGLAMAGLAARTGPRALAVLAIMLAWAARLSVHILRRRRGEPEDRRYQAIRRRNEPHFEWKSLYLVFGLQAVLAWLVSWPLMAAVAAPQAWSAMDGAGAALAVFGLVFESVADFQLARFKADPRHAGGVMDRGLWRFTRHPNYFGECCLGWGGWLLAAAAGGAWTVFSPLLMTVLLLKVSGVALLESDIAQRRPAYAGYIRRTNAFLPGRPRP